MLVQVPMMSCVDFVFLNFEQHFTKVRSFALIHVRGSSESTRCFYSVDTVNKKRTQSISLPSIFRLTVGKQQTQCTRIHLLLCVSWIRSPNENKYCFWNKSGLKRWFHYWRKAWISLSGLKLGVNCTLMKSRNIRKHQKSVPKNYNSFWNLLSHKYSPCGTFISW